VVLNSQIVDHIIYLLFIIIEFAIVIIDIINVIAVFISEKIEGGVVDVLVNIGSFIGIFLIAIY
jgi:hypothetical protein